MTEKKFEFTHAADVQPIGRATVGEDGAATRSCTQSGLGSREPRTRAELHFLRSAAFSLRSTASMTAFRIASLIVGGLTLSVSRRCNLPIASRKDSSTRRLIWVRCDMGG